MRLIYNGIDLMVLETYAFETEAVYDDTGVDYLYTRVSMVARCVVNGEARQVTGAANGPFISYAFGTLPTPPPPGAAPFRSAPASVPATPAGATPPLTVPGGTGLDRGIATTVPRPVVRVPNQPAVSLRAIRHRLEVPQRQLFIFADAGGVEAGRPPVGSTDPALPPGGNILVSSPGVGFVCDCNNGPKPKLLAVHTVLNDQTMLVDYQIETFINEAVENAANPNGPILSNRFAQRHDVGLDGYTTVSTDGTAIFRTDLIYGADGGGARVTPDVFRGVLFMPILQGFVRENIVVEGLPDVTGVRYAYQDRQVSVNFVAGPYAKAASISAVHRQAVTSDVNLPATILGTTERVLGLAANKNFAFPGGDRAAAAKEEKRAARMDKLVRKLLKKAAGP